MNASRMNGAPLRVLVVDDDEDLRENLAECLQAAGHEVTQAFDGADALELLALNGRPEVVVLDLVMPRLDGRAVAAAVRASPELRQARLVLMTGVAAWEVRDAAEFDAVHEKPFDLDQLLAELEKSRRPT